ncbi:ABC transporter permease [Domibacillus sp. PGB-M46]|uniref:ABC transporter permease n=1 Tax=Domibacillus sp. PGB-M46 TaxID=2910255 RepID=UPI001F5671F8|nr:ABC transporter permease [Domibacillus sp. PGB-M46]MCI2256445.1 ABC transporter permease [Domibacillus sp. PGB-M46]
MFSKWVVYLLLTPALIVLIGVFFIPMLLMLVQSLTDEQSNFTLANYALFFSEPFYWGVLWQTIKLSTFTVLGALILSYPVAMFMAQSKGKIRAIVTFLVLLPHLVSVVIRNFGWTIILNDRGMINTILLEAGIIDQPLRLMYNELGTVIGLVDSFVAYMILAIATSLYTINPSLYKAGAIMGANKVRNFISITLPLSLPGVYSGIVLVFSLSMSAFVTPTLLGGTSVKVMPALTYQQIMFTLNWPLGAAISFILLGTTIFLVSTFTKVTETKRYKVVFKS